MFDRSKLPDPTDYYTGTAGLKFRERKGKWRTTECRFHGGTDSMRINTGTGAFCCMAGCGGRRVAHGFGAGLPTGWKGAKAGFDLLQKA